MRTVLFVAPSIVGAVTLAVYVALGNSLTLETAFSTLSYINIVRFPLLLIPNAFALLGEGRASMKRIEYYLRQQDASCSSGTSIVKVNSNFAKTKNRREQHGNTLCLENHTSSKESIGNACLSISSENDK